MSVALGARAIRCWTALGDSLTAGFDPMEPHWADELSASLRRAAPGAVYVNLAVPGATSGEVVAQLDPAIALRPGLVTLTCGVNDVMMRVRPDLDGFDAAFSAMLARLRAELPDAAVFTAIYPDITRFYPLRPRSRQRVARGIRELNAVIRDASLRHDAACVDFASHPETRMRSNYGADGLHPSPAGHRYVAEAFAAALRDRLGLELDLAGKAD